MEDHTAYDYRMYDKVWQRVSPGCDPYGDTGALPHEHRTPAHSTTNSEITKMPALAARNEANLPGAQIDPCCMGSAAAESLNVLEGFIEEELAQRRCYLALAQRLCNGSAARLLRTLAQEKRDTAQELKTAYFLITGNCYENVVSIDHMRWNSLADALRSCYHREACNAFNYQRAADETIDTCLQQLLSRLSAQAFVRADALMSLLGQILC